MLVLDDYHVIVNDQIHEGLVFVLDHLPESMQLVIATRSDPPLPLGRMRVVWDLVEVQERTTSASVPTTRRCS